MLSEKQLQVVLKNWLELNKMVVYRALAQEHRYPEEIEISIVLDTVLIGFGTILLASFGLPMAELYLSATVSFPNTNLYFCLN